MKVKTFTLTYLLFSVILLVPATPSQAQRLAASVAGDHVGSVSVQPVAAAEKGLPVPVFTSGSQHLVPGALPVARSSSSLPRVFAPTQPRTKYTRFPWKRNIVATVFWIGELPTSKPMTGNMFSETNGPRHPKTAEPASTFHPRSAITSNSVADMASVTGDLWMSTKFPTVPGKNGEPIILSPIRNLPMPVNGVLRKASLKFVSCATSCSPPTATRKTPSSARKKRKRSSQSKFTQLNPGSSSNPALPRKVLAVGWRGLFLSLRQRLPKSFRFDLSPTLPELKARS